MLWVMGQGPEITEWILPEIKHMGTQGRLSCVVINLMDNHIYWVHRITMATISADDMIVIDDIFNPIIDDTPKFQVPVYAWHLPVYCISIWKASSDGDKPNV